MPRYTDGAKRSSRADLFAHAVSTLIDKGVAIGTVSALVLVDGTQPQMEDIQALDSLGISPSNVLALSNRWDSEVEAMYKRGDVEVVQTELSAFLAAPPEGRTFDLVYADFCKPLPNEPKEHHVAVIYNMFSNKCLSDESVVITNFSIPGYFDDQLYREFMLAYVAPDYHVTGTFGRMSVRAMSSGKNFMGPLFFSDKKIRPADELAEQKVRVLMCFMDSFVRDMAEVYVPSAPLRAVPRPNAEAEMDEYTGCNVPIESLPEHLRMRNKDGLFSRVGQCGRLLDSLPPAMKEHIEPYTGTARQLQALAYDLEYRCRDDIVLRNVYTTKLLGAWPYPSEAFSMLPIVWSATLNKSVLTSALWNAPCYPGL